MAKYTALTPLVHDGTHYAPGDVIDMDNIKAAKLLIDSNVIQPITKIKTEPNNVVS